MSIMVRTRKTQTTVAILAGIAIALISQKAFGKDYVPNWAGQKVQEDISWAVRHQMDPYLVLAHISTEAGAWALEIEGTKKFGEQTPTETRVRSQKGRHGDYGRHQIKCKTWFAIQNAWKVGDWKYTDFPPEATIKRCTDLYNDELNRVAYYYMIHKILEDRVNRRTRKKRYGVPIWLGYYQSGYREPKDRYLKRIGWWKRHLRKQARVTSRP